MRDKLSRIYFDAYQMEALDRLIGMLAHAKELMLPIPDRSGDENANL